MCICACTGLCTLACIWVVFFWTVHTRFNTYVQNKYWTRIQPFWSHKQTCTLWWMLWSETWKWWNWKERWRMTEDNGEESSVTIAVTPSRRKRRCILQEWSVPVEVRWGCVVPPPPQWCLSSQPYQAASTTMYMSCRVTLRPTLTGCNRHDGALVKSWTWMAVHTNCSTLSEYYLSRSHLQLSVGMLGTWPIL